MKLNSTSVKVFPAAKDRCLAVGNDTEISFSRLLTEFNVSNIIRQLIGTNNGFIISASAEKTNEVDTFYSILHTKFNLNGYYFDISFNVESLGTGLESGASYDVYAKLVYDGTTDSQELAQDSPSATGFQYDGLDIEVIKVGVTFDATDYLKLFSFTYNHDGTTGIASVSSVVPGDQHIFDATAMRIGGIDGKYNT